VPFLPALAGLFFLAATRSPPTSFSSVRLLAISILLTFPPLYSRSIYFCFLRPPEVEVFFSSVFNFWFPQVFFAFSVIVTRRMNYPLSGMVALFSRYFFWLFCFLFFLHRGPQVRFAGKAQRQVVGVFLIFCGFIPFHAPGKILPPLQPFLPPPPSLSSYNSPSFRDLGKWFIPLSFFLQPSFLPRSPGLSLRRYYTGVLLHFTFLFLPTSPFPTLVPFFFQPGY